MTSCDARLADHGLGQQRPEVGAPDPGPFRPGAVLGPRRLVLEAVHVDPGRPRLLDVGIVEQRQCGKAQALLDRPALGHLIVAAAHVLDELPGRIEPGGVFRRLRGDRVELGKAQRGMRLAWHRRHRELAGPRLVGGVVHGREHVVEHDGERVLAGVHRRDDLGFVRLRGHDPVLREGVLQPLQLLEGLRLRVIEQRVEVGIEHVAAAAVDLRDEGIIEIRQLLIVLVDDRLRHARLFELQARGEDVVPGLRHLDAVLVEDFLVVNEADDVGVVRQAVELVVVGHVAERVVGRLLFVLRDLGEIFFQGHEPAGRRPGRQPVLAGVDHVGLGIAAQPQHHRVVVVGPGVVGDVDLDAGILGLELGDVVLDRLERVVPDDELEGHVLGARVVRLNRPEHGRERQRARREQRLSHHAPSPRFDAAHAGRLDNRFAQSNRLPRQIQCRIRRRLPRHLLLQRRDARSKGAVIRRRRGFSYAPSTPMGISRQRRVRLFERNSGSQKLKMVP